MDESKRAVRDAVTALYLETGKSQDAKQIAARLGWSKGKLYRVLQETGGSDGVEFYVDWLPSHERSYGNESGVHRVRKYHPTLRHLRGLILDLREKDATRLDIENA